MKNINIVFEDAEAERLEGIKGETTWHDFIMQLTNIRIYRAFIDKLGKGAQFDKFYAEYKD